MEEANVQEGAGECVCDASEKPPHEHTFLCYTTHHELRRTPERNVT